MKTLLKHYGDVRHQIRDGDLLLYRRRGPIAVAGRGHHCHAAKAAWWGDDLFLLEMLQFSGGRAVTLSSQVQHWPGRYDLFEVKTDDRAVDRRPPFCSHACAMADRLGGQVDPVPQLSDRLTEPADLARSPFYRYRFTLI